ncbi:MAG: histidine phosphatase family protein [Reyranella sp.]|nr:MAG: histidine phosphatase family protein [Reyranella sp.]
MDTLAPHLQLPLLEAPLYVLRHGQTAWNVERRLQGALNSDLTVLGREQASAAGRKLATVLPHDRQTVRFLRSPLGRTRETSLLVGRELGIDPTDWQDDPRLAEHGSGAWEGLTWPEIERDRPGAYADWRRDPVRHGPPGGESHRDLERRSASVLAEIAASRTCTVVVGHGVSGAVLRGLAQGLHASEALSLDKPQTAFFRLRAGCEERIEAM